MPNAPDARSCAPPRLRLRSCRHLSAWVLSSTSLGALLCASSAQAQSTSLVDVCSGLGVKLPHLTSPAPITSSFSLVNGLTSTLTGLVGDINQGIVAPLSDVTVRVGVFDTNGNCPTSAPVGQIEGLHERRMAGSS